MNYTPTKNRVIVEVINNTYEKTESGLYLSGEDEKTESKHNIVKARLVKVGKSCEDFVQESVGITVLIHEVAGTPMTGVGGKDFRIMREDDIWAYLPPELDTTVQIDAQALKAEQKDINSRTDGVDFHNEVFIKDQT